MENQAYNLFALKDEAVTQVMSVVPWEKWKKILSNYWVSNKIKYSMYQMQYIWSN